MPPIRAGEAETGALVGAEAGALVPVTVPYEVGA